MRVDGSYLIVAAMLTMVSCATTYKVATVPAGVSVFHKTGTDEAFLGETPLDFEKSGLPSDKPFSLVFKKDGYEKREMVVTPTDDAMTTISVNLKQLPSGQADENLVRSRKILKQVFNIQEFVSAKRYVDAMSALNALEKEEPKLPEVYMLKGSVYFMLDEKELAKGQWEKALELDPGLARVREQLNELKGNTAK